MQRQHLPPPHHQQHIPPLARQVVSVENHMGFVRQTLGAPLNLAERPFSEIDPVSPWTSANKLSTRHAIVPRFFNDLRLINAHNESTQWEWSIKGTWNDHLNSEPTDNGDLMFGMHIYCAVPGILHPDEHAILEQEEEKARVAAETVADDVDPQIRLEHQRQLDEEASLVFGDGATRAARLEQVMDMYFPDKVRPYVSYVPSLGSVLFHKIERKFGESVSMGTVYGEFIERTNHKEGVDKSNYALIGRRYEPFAAYQDSKINRYVGIPIEDSWYRKQALPLRFLENKNKLTLTVHMGNINQLWQSSNGAGHQQANFFPINRNTKQPLKMTDFNPTIMGYSVFLEANTLAQIMNPSSSRSRQTVHLPPQAFPAKRNYLIEQVLCVRQTLMPTALELSPDEIKTLPAPLRDNIAKHLDNITSNTFNQYIYYPEITRFIQHYKIEINDERPVKMLFWTIQTQSNIDNNNHNCLEGNFGREILIEAGVMAITTEVAPDQVPGADTDPTKVKFIERRTWVHKFAPAFVFRNIHSKFFQGQPDNFVYGLPINNNMPNSAFNMGCAPSKTRFELLLKLQPGLEEQCEVKVWVVVFNECEFGLGEVKMVHK